MRSALLLRCLAFAFAFRGNDPRPFVDDRTARIKRKGFLKQKLTTWLLSSDADRPGVLAPSYPGKSLVSVSSFNSLRVGS